ncbi:MAG TPA: glycoside hydrolase N-terminal domain-containing protein [Pseudosphingobacterium sp.]|nr:glycoside hydrolase N-terminal domain-containing protein [Pseudosphingobacterium sp.]
MEFTFKILAKNYKPYLLLILLFSNIQVDGQALKLWYQEPAKQWTEALPIGNGKMGAMVFGGVEQDRIQFNEESLWTGGPRDYNMPNGHKYLANIRKLLSEGKQAEAEKLAGLHFMGTKSASDEPTSWFKNVREIVNKEANPSQITFDDSRWSELTLPVHDGWEKAGLEGLDGALWFRTVFTIPDDWKDQDLVLDIGKIRDQDFTYLNGKMIGTTNDMNQGRLYVIPKGLVQKQNQLAIQVLNYDDKGGLVGYKDIKRKLRIYPKGKEGKEISLSKPWRYWIQDEEAPRVGKYQEAYQPFGDLRLTFDSLQTITNYKRSLDLKEAICKTSYTSNHTHYERTYFASAVDSCIALQVVADKRASVNFRVTFSTPHKVYEIKKLNDSTISLSLKVEDGSLEGVSLLQVCHRGGSVSVRNGTIDIKGADEAVLLLTAATNFKNYQDVSANPFRICQERIDRLASRSYITLKQDHIKDYQSYFDRFSLNFGADNRDFLPTNQRIAQFATTQDPNLLALFVQYGRYLLISSSRPGSLPPNLQGIWNDLLTPPWGSKYTTNINAEMNYWPAEPTNLSDLNEPLFRMIEELSKAGQKTARAYYDAPGWVLHHNTDLWRGTAPINNPNHGIWVTGGAWLCQHLWEHYLYTQDLGFLKETAYPLMKASAEFFDKFLTVDPKTGWLISTPSNSPEQGGLVAGPTMDHQIIRQLFQNVAAAAKRLGVDSAFEKKLVHKSTKIAPNQIGRYGQLQEWLEDVDDSTNKHRHVSHLWAVYPGREINWQETPKLMEAAKKSLIFRGDEGTGWSLAWKINLWARIRDAEHAYNMVKMLISPMAQGGGVYPNLFDAHPPFQIDGNFGGTSGVTEMLLQSHLGTIDVLPALPEALSDGEVKGICARGGFELSYAWKAGKLTQLEILSKAGGVCKIRHGDRISEFEAEKGKKYYFDNQLRQINRTASKDNIVGYNSW